MNRFRDVNEIRNPINQAYLNPRDCDRDQFDVGFLQTNNTSNLDALYIQCIFLT